MTPIPPKRVFDSYADDRFLFGTHLKKFWEISLDCYHCRIESVDDHSLTCRLGMGVSVNLRCWMLGCCLWSFLRVLDKISRVRLPPWFLQDVAVHEPWNFPSYSRVILSLAQWEEERDLCYDLCVASHLLSLYWF